MLPTLNTLDRLAPPRGEGRRILFLAHRLPHPPDKGDRIRAFRFLEHLARRHAVWCAAFTESDSPPASVALLREICRDVAVIPWSRRAAKLRAARALLTGGPLTAAAYRCKLMECLVDYWVAEHRIESVVAFSSAMAPYALRARGCRRVLDYCDIDSQKWSDLAGRGSLLRAALLKLEARRLREAELAWADRADCTLVINHRERDLVARFLEPQRLAVVGNGVDAPASADPPAAAIGPVVGFVGTMDYAPNIDAMRWFIAEVWPRVRVESPRAALLIVGRNPPRALQRLGGRDGICVTGAVGETADLVRRIRVGIAPLRVARGLPNKVLELMAFGRPVVATSAVGECVECGAEAGLLVADDSAMFARHVVSLLTDDARCARAAAAARRRALARFDWASRAIAYERLVLGVAEPAAPRKVIESTPADRRIGRTDLFESPQRELVGLP